MTATVRLERRAARSRLGRIFPGLGVAFGAAGGYLYGGWRWGVVVLVVALLAAALLAWAARSRLGRIFLRPHEETFHPEFLASLVVAFVAAGGYLYGGWRWGVVGLLAAALLALKIRARWTGPSPSPAEHGRG